MDILIGMVCMCIIAIGPVFMILVFSDLGNSNGNILKCAGNKTRVVLRGLLRNIDKLIGNTSFVIVIIFLAILAVLFLTPFVLIVYFMFFMRKRESAISGPAGAAKIVASLLLLCAVLWVGIGGFLTFIFGEVLCCLSFSSMRAST